MSDDSKPITLRLVALLDTLIRSSKEDRAEVVAVVTKAIRNLETLQGTCTAANQVIQDLNAMLASADIADDAETAALDAVRVWLEPPIPQIVDPV